MPEDYLRLVSNLQFYLAQELVFIDPEESKWKRELETKGNWKTYLIGQLGDIELHMLHHHDEDTARRKWNDRVRRVNYRKILYKFNDQNGATKEDIKHFMSLNLQHKVCFVADAGMKVNEDVIYVRQPHRYDGQGIKASREPFGKSKDFDVNKYINSL